MQQSHAQLQQHVSRCHTTQDALKPAQSLADTFDQKVILLIFGKFNAGKSSLCNVLADCFVQQQQNVQYFYLDAGDIIYCAETFKEGATETTARLQGVCLSEDLILLDTPGLHSVTPENAALTQKFMDSADGVLWLSSSSSPGQVKELEALARELHRHKPLLPVITRSDYFEENELDGEIFQVLCNKTPTQRQLQALDVQTRATQKLTEMQVEPSLLHSPISVSAQMLKRAAFNDQAMQESGFEALFEALFQLVQPALSYKQRNPAEILLHHLQEQVLTPLLTDITLQLNQLRQKITDTAALLPQQKQSIINQTWRTIVPALPTALEQHAAQQAIDELCSSITLRLEQALAQKMVGNLADYQLKIPPVSPLQLPKHLSYDVIYNDQQEILTIGHERLYHEISQQLLQLLTSYTDDVILQCQTMLAHLQDRIEAMQQVAMQCQQDLRHIAQNLRVK